MSWPRPWRSWRDRATPSFGPGDVIGERVRIVRLLGRGGMGRVFLGDDLLTGQQVAVKCCCPRCSMAPSSCSASSMRSASPRRPVIPALCAACAYRCHQRGQLYQLMEYVRGAAARAADRPRPLGRRPRLPCPGCRR